MLCDCNLVNLCVMLKTGGEPEKLLELQNNDVFIKYRLFPGVWRRDGFVAVIAVKLISGWLKFSLICNAEVI